MEDLERDALRIPFTERFEKIRENLHFILVEPETPGNIGAAARAMKTCGFKKLILVNPIQRDWQEAHWLAHRSDDILESARTVATFAEAVSDLQTIIGTTQRPRSLKKPLLSPQQAGAALKPLAVDHPVGIVFGRESSGLSNDELDRCNFHSSIPTATTKPSLNLAQAVMIYAHTFFVEQNDTQADCQLDLASQGELEHFYQHLTQAVDVAGFTPRDSAINFKSRFQRFFGRSQAEKRDIRLMHKLLDIFEQRIKKLETIHEQSPGS